MAKQKRPNQENARKNTVQSRINRDVQNKRRTTFEELVDNINQKRGVSDAKEPS